MPYVNGEWQNNTPFVNGEWQDSGSIVEDAKYWSSMPYYNPYSALPPGSSLNGQTEEEYYAPGGRGYMRALQNTIALRYGQLIDPNSDYYKNFRQDLLETISSAYNPNSLLAVARGMGLSGKGAATVVNEQSKNIRKTTTDKVNTTMKEFYQTMSQQANQILGLYQRGEISAAQLQLEYQKLQEMKRQFDKGIPGFGEQLGVGMLQGGLYALGQGVGG